MVSACLTAVNSNAMSDPFIFSKFTTQTPQDPRVQALYTRSHAARVGHAGRRAREKEARSAIIVPSIEESSIIRKHIKRSESDSDRADARVVKELINVDGGSRSLSPRDKRRNSWQWTRYGTRGDPFECINGSLNPSAMVAVDFCE